MINKSRDSTCLCLRASRYGIKQYTEFIKIAAARENLGSSTKTRHLEIYLTRPKMSRFHAAENLL